MNGVMKIAANFRQTGWAAGTIAGWHMPAQSHAAINISPCLPPYNLAFCAERLEAHYLDVAVALHRTE